MKNGKLALAVTFLACAGAAALALGAATSSGTGGRIIGTGSRSSTPT